MNGPSDSPSGRLAGARVALLGGVLACAPLAVAGAAAPPRADAKADKLWAKAEQATAKEAWDAARVLFGQFAKKHAGDPRAAEAQARFDGNTVLAVVPLYVTGPKENRLDVYGSADGMLSTSKDQQLLRSTVTNYFHEALVLPPYDAYWSYFNWYCVHAASAKQGHSDDAGKTIFGGRHGSAGAPSGDAWMDFNAVRPLIDRHCPDYDLFCAYVQGHNGWPSISHSMQCVGTANLRYWPRVISRNRLDDAEVWNEVVMLPELQKRFDAAWKQFQAKIAAEQRKFRNLTVREWRAMTAEWDIPMNTGTQSRSAVRGKRDRKAGKPGGNLGGRAFNTLNQFIDLTRHPDDMRVQDRPLPPFEKIPWYHWLLKGDPTVTVVPTIKLGYSETSANHMKFHDDGTVEFNYPAKKKHLYDKVKRKYGGRMPDSDEIKRNIGLTYYCHESCHLGGASLKGGVGGSPLYCAVCREEAVRAIYRYVDPIDRAEPAAGAIGVEDPAKRLEFAVYPLKPLDHFLTVEWRLDGEVQKSGAKRELRNRTTGKRVSKLPRFPSKPRSRQYFDPAKESHRASAAAIKCARAHAATAVRESFSVRPADLAPGTHTIEVIVIDETPWVLWDPENLLTSKVTWTFEVK